MSRYDLTGWEREPFAGRSDVQPTRRRRRSHAGHGPDCSTNPEIGCICPEEERHYARLERAEARRFPNAAAEGVRGWVR